MDREREEESSPGATDLRSLCEMRKQKLEKLRARGITGYAYRFDRTHSAAEAVSAFESAETGSALDTEGYGPRVRVAGRLVSVRSHGKTSFAHIDDESGRIQTYLRRDVLGDEVFDNLELLDLGDWLGVSGALFRTRMGEITIRVDEWQLLAKSVRPLPLGKTATDRESGDTRSYSILTDREARYRQRYADLAVNPRVREVFRTRRTIVRALRRHLDDLGFLEVETPALQPVYGGASARPFITHHNTMDRKFYLRIADELYLKRLIVGGFEKVYEICKDFRNEGIDRFHNPEFTMLELYQAHADYHDMMRLVETMLSDLATTVTGGPRVRYQSQEISFAPPFARLQFVEALDKALGRDVLALTVAELRALAEKHGISDANQTDRGKLLDRLFGELVQPGLIQPTFVIDYPRELCPLARAHRDNEALAERFECFVAGLELANAFSELNDPADQLRQLERQRELRRAGDDEAQDVDLDYVRALEYGLPPTGGVGIGVDRLTMLLTNQASIRDVILFPALRDDVSSPPD